MPSERPASLRRRRAGGLGGAGFGGSEGGNGWSGGGGGGGGGGAGDGAEDLLKAAGRTAESLPPGGRPRRACKARRRWAGRSVAPEPSGWRRLGRGAGGGQADRGGAGALPAALRGHARAADEAGVRRARHASELTSCSARLARGAAARARADGGAARAAGASASACWPTPPSLSKWASRRGPLPARPLPQAARRAARPVGGSRPSSSASLPRCTPRPNARRPQAHAAGGHRHLHQEQRRVHQARQELLQGAGLCGGQHHHGAGRRLHARLAARAHALVRVRAPRSPPGTLRMCAGARRRPCARRRRARSAAKRGGVAAFLASCPENAFQKARAQRARPRRRGRALLGRMHGALLCWAAPSRGAPRAGAKGLRALQRGAALRRGAAQRRKAGRRGLWLLADRRHGHQRDRDRAPDAGPQLCAAQRAAGARPAARGALAPPAPLQGRAEACGARRTC